MPLDFAQYKPRLIDYIRLKGHEVREQSNFRCLVHKDGAVPSKWSSRIIDDGETYHCYGCGFHGDIYDLVGELEGVEGVTDQYRFLVDLFGGEITTTPVGRMKPAPKPRFIPDTDAIATVTEWLKSVRGQYIREIEAFAHARGYDDSRYCSRMAYWPGMARCPLDDDVLIASGIYNDARPGDSQAWNHAGVVLRVGLGFKLHYIGDDGSTIKRESRGGHTFPFPALPKGDTVVLVEGELDAVSCRYAGIDNAVSIGGTNGLSVEDALSLANYIRIIIAFDNDEAGKIASGLLPPIHKRYKSVPMILSEAGYTGEILIANWPEGVDEKDPDDFVKHGKVAILEEAINGARPYAELCGGGLPNGNIRIQEVRDVKGSNEQGSAITVDGDEGIVEEHEPVGNGEACVHDNGRREGDDNPSEAAGLDSAEGNGPSVSKEGSRGLEGFSRSSKSGQQEDLIPRDKIPFQFLGFDADSYYVLPKRQNIAYRVPRGDKSIKDKLYEIASPAWWESYFSKEGENGPCLDARSAIDWFRENQIRKGMYNDDLIFGTGAHHDGDNIVVNTGRGVCTPSGEWSTYESYMGENTYCRSKRELKLGSNPWTIEEGRHYIEQLETFTFESPLAYYAIAGYCALSPFASALFRRPHIWLTAKKGTGKSYLMKELMYPLVGEGYALYKDGLTTEAAFRQSLKRDNLPILNDEFEITRKEDQSIIDGVLTLSRIAYSGESISKGTSNQSGISFSTKMMFCFGSINVNIKNDADRSRIVVCRMQESNGEMKRIKNVDGLRGRMFLRLNTINQEIDAAHDMIEGLGFDSRTADTYAPFLVGYWSILSDSPFGVCVTESDTDMYNRMAELIPTINKEAEKTTDEDRILSRIFQEKIRIVSNNTEMTIAEMLQAKNEMQQLTYDHELQINGIRRMMGTDPMGCDGTEVLCINTKNDIISNILRETPFANYMEVLRRNTAYIRSRSVYIGGSLQSSMIFRWRDIAGKYFNEAEEEPPF